MDETKQPFLTNLRQDLLYGCRLMIRKPAVTIVAALSLALGIGANTVIFSLINTTLLRPLPFEDPENIMVAWTMDAAALWRKGLI